MSVRQHAFFSQRTLRLQPQRSAAYRLFVQQALPRYRRASVMTKRRVHGADAGMHECYASEARDAHKAVAHAGATKKSIYGARALTPHTQAASYAQYGAIF